MKSAASQNLFNVMTQRIHELMAQNIREQEAKRKSELKALQSQINPHFLYNTLDSIIWMAEGKKKRRGCTDDSFSCPSFKTEYQ